MVICLREHLRRIGQSKLLPSRQYLCCRSGNIGLGFRSVKEFIHELQKILRAEPFCENQRALAQRAGLDPGHLHRVLGDRAAASPEFVGRLCGTLPASDAARLLKAFLSDVIAETSEASPNPAMKGEWKKPTSDLMINLGCSERSPRKQPHRRKKPDGAGVG
jgi:hypothetical protein